MADGKSAAAGAGAGLLAAVAGVAGLYLAGGNIWTSADRGHALESAQGENHSDWNSQRSENKATGERLTHLEDRLDSLEKYSLHREK